MTITNQTKNITKKDLINARASSSFKELTDFVKVNDACVALDVDVETGEEREYGYLFTDRGVFAGSSATVIAGISDIIDLITDGESVSAKAIGRESKNGRTFYTLEVE